MKVFISQPMNGKSNEEIEAIREDIVNDLKESFKEEVIILDSFFKDAPHEAKPVWFLGKSLEVMSEADVVYFAKDWENARGCRIEHTVAKEYGLKIMEEK